MVSNILKQAALGIAGVAFTATAFATDSSVSPPVTPANPTEISFPAPTGITCFASVCSAPTAHVSPHVAAQSVAAQPQATGSTCQNLLGYTAAVPYDINGDCVSDLIWINDDTHQFGYWQFTPNTVSRTISRLFSYTPGYSIAAIGDFNGDGKADMIWTSANRDLYLWTSNGSGFTSTYIGVYPAGWTLLGAGDVTADGKDDLIWENDTLHEYGYWQMNGAQVLNRVTYPMPANDYRISFIQSQFDSPGLGAAIYFSAPGSTGMTQYFQAVVNNGVFYLAPYAQLANAVKFAGGGVVATGSGQPPNMLMLFDAVQANGSNNLSWSYNPSVGVNGAAGQMAGYQIVAMGHFTGIAPSNGIGVINTEDAIWADANGNLVLWMLQPTGTIPTYLGPNLGGGVNAYTLPKYPLGWHVVRPGVQN